jgi:hypothetical protein
VKVDFILGRDGVAHNIEIVNAPGYGMDLKYHRGHEAVALDSVFIHEDQNVDAYVCPETGPLDWLFSYFNFAYSALACFRIGMSGSASFHSAKKSWYAVSAFALSPSRA